MSNARVRQLVDRYLKTAARRLGRGQARVLSQILYATSFKAKNAPLGKISLWDVRADAEGYPKRTLLSLQKLGYLLIEGKDIYLTDKAIEEARANKGWPLVNPVRDENQELVDIEYRGY